MTMENNKDLNIKDDSTVASRALKTHLAMDDRPREKAKAKGFGNLSTAELLAILIGSGSRGESVVELCQRILHDNDDKLYKIARCRIKELTSKYKGIGEVKAIEMLAALELARRYQSEKFVVQTQITSSETAYEYFKPLMQHLDHEEIWMLMLNRAKRIIDRINISKGGSSSTVGDIKMILRSALENLADGIIIAHNHPSDNPNPSLMDDNLTNNIKQGCKAVGIELVDHIIVCRGTYYSYVDNGKI